MSHLPLTTGRHFFKGYLLCVTRVFGHTDIDVYEPSRLCGQHSTVTSEKAEWFGQVQTRDLPPEVNAIPNRPAESLTRRLAACDAVRKAWDEEATAIVKEAFGLEGPTTMAHYAVRVDLDQEVAAQGWNPEVSGFFPGDEALLQDTEASLPPAGPPAILDQETLAG